MVLFNYSTKELTAKIVYYGPGLCGKTTNLQYIHGNLPGNVKGKMLSLATKTDRTLFFDFLPIDLGEIRGMKTRVQLYTVPGQVFYNETRKLVLKGADGIVFVADSQEQMLSANAESFKNLEENLKGHGLTLAEMPHVIQLNKRDLPKLATIEQLNESMNKYNAPFYESVATTGIGVQDTLKAITKLVLLNLTTKYDSRSTAAAAKEPTEGAAPMPTPQAPAARPAETQVIPLTSIQPTIDAPAVAVASVQVEAEAEPVVAANVEPVAPAADSEFDDQEIDNLVGEVEELEGIAEEEPLAAAPDAGTPFEIDDTHVEPEEPELAADAPDTDGPLEPAFTDEPSDGDAGREEVLLTQVADDAELFDDPNLDVAGIAPGQEREIVIPVEMGAEGQTKRFKLSVRLRLDPVD